jgi:hypothetical protein
LPTPGLPRPSPSGQVALGYAQQRIAADLGNALLLLSTSTAETLQTNNKEALNVVSQAYARERADLRSATSLATGDRNAVSAITALEQSLGLSEPIDTARVAGGLQAGGEPPERAD